MTGVKLKKWQKAPQHCDKWVESIEQAKELVQNKYSDVTELYNRSLEFDHLQRTGSFTDDLKPEARKVNLMIWDFINECEKIGGEFINSEIGLYRRYPLSYYWISLSHCTNDSALL